MRFEPGRRGMVKDRLARLRSQSSPQRPETLDRIDTLTRSARGAWFSLLFLLAFVGVTLTGVEDADFFISSRQTPLPLLGVSIPTFVFFALTPLLCVALYANLHFHLLKLWKAIAAAPNRHAGEPVSESLNPSFILDFALAQRRDGALAERPLLKLATFFTGLLVFLAAPLVVGAFWWRSMPAHSERVTCLAIGAPLLVAIFVGLRSWAHLRAKTDIARELSHKTIVAWRWAFAVLCVTLTLFGWFRTEATLDQYARWLGIDDDWIEANLWSLERVEWIMARADLADVDFVGLPPGWQDHDTAEKAFRLAWCQDRGLPVLGCHLGRGMGDTERELAMAERTRWCARNPKMTEAACTERFSALAQEQQNDWESYRAAEIRSVPGVRLAGRDLRLADLIGARMEGADLSLARMEGAKLSEARMEEADLIEARMEGADLSAASMQGAVLIGAWMEGANLRGARMERANLSVASMQGADLFGASMEGAGLNLALMEGTVLSQASMEGAFLIGVRMEGAKLSEVSMDSSTSFSPLTLRGAVLREVDFTDVTIHPDTMREVFGDATVLLPDGVQLHPDSPVNEELDGDEFYTRWRAWQVDIGYRAPD